MSIANDLGSVTPTENLTYGTYLTVLMRRKRYLMIVNVQFLSFIILILVEITCRRSGCRRAHYLVDVYSRTTYHHS